MDKFNKDITLTNPLDWIGRGIALDRTFNRHSGQFNVSKSIDKINQSIYIILSTRIGTRFMLPKFGSKLHELLFEPNDFIFADLADLYIREALGVWKHIILYYITVIQLICNRYRYYIIMTPTQDIYICYYYPRFPFT